MQTVGQMHASPASADDTGTLDIRDVARLLKVSTRSVRRLVQDGAICPPIRIGRLIRWPKKQILTWIAAGCPANATNCTAAEPATGGAQ
jgi:excisionase family DNA binding protein